MTIPSIPINEFIRSSTSTSDECSDPPLRSRLRAIRKAHSQSRSSALNQEDSVANGRSLIWLENTNFDDHCPMLAMNYSLIPDRERLYVTR